MPSWAAQKARIAQHFGFSDFGSLIALANCLVIAGLHVMPNKPSMVCHFENTCCSDCCLDVSTNSIE